MLMNEAAELLVRKLNAAAKAELPVDIHKLLGEMTMGVVGTTAFGLIPLSGYEQCMSSTALTRVPHERQRVSAI